MTDKLITGKLSERIARALNLSQRRQDEDDFLSVNAFASDGVCARTLNLLTGREFDKTTAEKAWENIHDHWQVLNDLLERDVGFFVAALDYFENIDTEKTTKYVFVEEARLKALFDQSTLDGLTQLYNHQTFIMMLEKELEFSRRKHSPLTLVMADIDNFKRVNDQFGHQQGDKVLNQVARILKQSLRAMDVAGRYGGEEFIMVFPDTDAETAREIAERIRGRIESTFQSSCRITISMGMASYPEVEGKTRHLIQIADQALYRAKREGKNQLYRHHPS